MRDIESGVSKHHASYDVLARIRAGLVEMGHDPDRISPEDLKLVDEFHIGGAEATAALLEKLDIRPDLEVLDISPASSIILFFLAGALIEVKRRRSGGEHRDGEGREKQH